MQKQRVAVLFGGRSSEHEVSLRSGAAIIQHLDRSRFDIVPIFINHDGEWLLYDINKIKYAENNAICSQHDAKTLALSPSPSAQRYFDVVFPIMHGALCEDGALQGLLELMEVPYVGADVLGSAIAMDKEISKKLVEQAGIAVAPYRVVTQQQWQAEQAAIIQQLADTFAYPYFVKPIATGSSVGIHKIKSETDVVAAVADALSYNERILFEKAIDGNDIEVGVIEHHEPGKTALTSLPGQIETQFDFYSYEAKYLDASLQLHIPAKVSDAINQRLQAVAAEVFSLLRCEGMARVDFLLEKGTQRIIFNEINSLPGYTPMSAYPKLWLASGMTYKTLLSRFVDLALSRYQRKQRLKNHYHAARAEIANHA